MASKLSELKKKSGGKQIDKLRDELKKSKESGGGRDERIWKPTLDKEKGTGYAKVRLLPAPQGEDLPWIKVFRHQFKGPTGKWYIENCLSTIGKSDPVNDLNRKLWNSGIESDKAVARNQKRKVTFFSNVLVLKDSANPENEGKVFLYEYGTQIQKIIEEKIDPQFEDEEAAVPFDFWEGCDLNIKIVGVELNNNQVPNYEKSYFDEKSALFDGDEDKLQEVWDRCYSLKQFIEPENFQSYSDLQSRLLEVLGPTVGSGIDVSSSDVPQPSVQKEKPAPLPKSSEPDGKEEKAELDETDNDTDDEKESKEDSVDMSSGDFEDDLEFFNTLDN